MGLSLPCREQRGQYRRLPAESKRDVAAAKAFFRKALRTHGRAPISITLDGYAASHRAVREMPSENGVWKHTKLRSSSRDQVQNQTHARIQALRLCCHHDCRNRTTTSYSQRPIRPRILTPQRPSRPISGTLSSLHRSILLQALILPHRNYLHQSLFPHAPAQLDGAETVAEKLLTTAFS